MGPLMSVASLRFSPPSDLAPSLERRGVSGNSFVYDLALGILAQANGALAIFNLAPVSA
jgi:hypothetical protein